MICDWAMYAFAHRQGLYHTVPDAKAARSPYPTRYVRVASKCHMRSSMIGVIVGICRKRVPNEAARMGLLLLLLLLFVRPLPVAGAELQDATGRSIRIPDQPVRVLPAGPPAAVLLATLAPELMLGWPHAPSPAARMWLPAATVDLTTVPMLTGRHVTDEVAALHPDVILDYGAISPRYVQMTEGV